MIQFAQNNALKLVRVSAPAEIDGVFLVEADGQSLRLIYEPLHDPYTEWLQAHFTPEQQNDPQQSGESIDFDGDGIPNALEFAQGTDPTDSGSRLPMTVDFTPEGPALRFQVREPLPGFALGLEMSNDLVGWSPGLSQINDGTFQSSDNTAFEIQTARD